ncbi:MAG: prephenate/arogenate dehydrogenase [Synechococcaceae bacterium WB9_2_112]|nr:prephenate/arogenate dehydrogenase [Synechococcaceae bacterium WB9_2_112]
MAVDSVHSSSWRNEPVGIVGLGLIGGSIALDLRRQGVQVQALVNRSETAERARQRGLADVVSTDAAVLSDCAVVVLALPLDRLLDPDPALVAAIPQQAVLTDVGSVKTPVLAVWQGLHQRFVASHPMAGTAQAGIEAGLEGLFVGRPWVATPTAQTDAIALACVQDLAGMLGARWLCCPAADHDRAVALISHLPVLVSAALLQTADRAAATADGGSSGTLSGLVRALASSGFADTTRVGGGNPMLGTLMARTNREALQQAVAAYQQALIAIEQQLSAGDWSALESDLRQAQSLRPQFVQADRSAG